MAGLNVAAANLERAEFELERATQLFQEQDQLLSESAFQDAKTSAAVSRAQHQSATHQVEIAKASLKRAQEDLAKTTIRAPLDGTITKLNSELGERVLGTVQNMGTEIMVISDLDTMEARVDIGEIDIVLIKIDQRATLEMDAFRDTKFTGIVSEIANSANTTGAGSQLQATKFQVKIRINEKAEFRPGMSVTAEIETQYRTNVLTVPFQSVTSRLPKDADSAQKNAKETATKDSRNKEKGKKPVEGVFLVEDGRAVMVEVERGISDDDYVEITSGLEAGSEVVSGGYKVIASDLEDGKLVRIGGGESRDRSDTPSPPRP